MIAASGRGPINAREAKTGESMKRSKKTVTVLHKGVRLTEEIAPRDLEGVTGGHADVNRNVGCGGPNDCIAVQQF